MHVRTEGTIQRQMTKQKPKLAKKAHSEEEEKGGGGRCWGGKDSQ